MIKSFKCKQTAKLYNKQFVKKFSGFARQAEKKLRLLDAAKVHKLLILNKVQNEFSVALSYRQID